LERFGFLILLPALCTAAVILLSTRLPSLEETRKMLPTHFIVRRIGLAAGSYNETTVPGASQGMAAPFERNASRLPTTVLPSTLTPSELHAIEVATAKRLQHASLLRIVQALRTEWDNAHPGKAFGNEDARELWQAARRKMEEKDATAKAAAADDDDEARRASEAVSKTRATPYPTTMSAEQLEDAETRSERELEEALNRALSRGAEDAWPSSEPTEPTTPPYEIVEFPVDPLVEDFGTYEAQFGSDILFGNDMPVMCTHHVPEGSFAVAWCAAPRSMPRSARYPKVGCGRRSCRETRPVRFGAKVYGRHAWRRFIHVPRRKYRPVRVGCFRVEQRRSGVLLKIP
jgi:hypothetical protein